MHGQKNIKKTKYSSSFGQNTGIQNKLVATYKRNAPYYITVNTKQLQINMQKKPGQTIQETYRSERQQWVSKWPDSMFTT